MKKWLAFVLISLMLTGCGQTSTLETLGNPCAEQQIRESRDIVVDLPQQLAAPVLQNEENGILYLCEGYTITLQTLPGGSLDETLKECSGFSRDQLTILETQGQDYVRYDCVWACVGEKADEVCRMAILDDGCYHYVVTAMAPSEQTQDYLETWNEIFGSISLDTVQ